MVGKYMGWTTRKALEETRRECEGKKRKMEEKKAEKESRNKKKVEQIEKFDNITCILNSKDFCQREVPSPNIETNQNLFEKKKRILTTKF